MSQHESLQSGPFTDSLISSIAELYEQITHLEFLTRLGDGSLPLDAFHRYIAQDSLYLAQYSKALSMVSAKAPHPVASASWSQYAIDAATGEVELHHEILAGLEPVTEPTPTCLGYVSFLLATAATDTYLVGASAVLPCFWIYSEVGQQLAETAAQTLNDNPNHPYAKWVQNYGDPVFREATAEARRLIDEVAEQASESERARARQAFIMAARYELMFWDTALHTYDWPCTGGGQGAGRGHVGTAEVKDCHTADKGV